MRWGEDAQIDGGSLDGFQKPPFLHRIRKLLAFSNVTSLCYPAFSSDSTGQYTKYNTLSII